MSETEDLLAVYGAVDIAVEGSDSPDTRSRVAALIPLYDSLEVHWYRDFLQWRVDEGVQLPDSVGTTWDSTRLALQNLARNQPGSNRLAARRLLGLHALAQTQIDVFGPRGDFAGEVQGALAALLEQRQELGADREGRANEAARLVHEFMAQDILAFGARDADENWSVLVSNVRLYVQISGLEQRPCTSRFKTRPGGRPVPRLESVFDVKDVEFDNAIKFLDPEKWPDCMDFWCEMEPVPGLPDDVHRYNEMVSSNCKHPDDAVFTARAVLDFTFTKRPNTMFTRYDLAPGHPGGDVTVDEGALIVQRMTGFLRITTTKTLEFSRVFRSDQLAAIGCALGWTDQGKAMMYNCARLPKDVSPGASPRDVLGVSSAGDFPERVLSVASGSTATGTTDTPRGGSTPAPATTGSQQDAVDGGAMLPDIARQTAKAIKDCVDDQAAFVEKWSERASGEGYGYQEMLDDVARASLRMVVDSARILNLAVRNAEVASAAARPRGADEPAASLRRDREDEGQ
jgi:hypothetical protein